MCFLEQSVDNPQKYSVNRTNGTGEINRKMIIYIGMQNSKLLVLNIYKIVKLPLTRFIIPNGSPSLSLSICEWLLRLSLHNELLQWTAKCT